MGRRPKKLPRRFQQGGKRRPKKTRPIFGAAPRFRYGSYDRIMPGALTSDAFDPVTEVIGRPGIAPSSDDPPTALEIALQLEKEELDRAERNMDSPLVAPIPEPGHAERQIAGHVQRALENGDPPPPAPFKRTGMLSAYV